MLEVIEKFSLARLRVSLERLLQVAAVIHEWSYDAMCHDLLDLEGNKYSYEVWHFCFFSCLGPLCIDCETDEWDSAVFRSFFVVFSCKCSVRARGSCVEGRLFS